MKLQEAALTFIVCQLSTKEEEENMRKTFEKLDKNGNGTISKDELFEGYMEMYKGKKTESEIKTEVEIIMQNIDIDGSGLIDYSEWALGAINKKNLLTKEKLKKAFEMFDKDNSGTISAEEIKNVLGLGKQIESEEVWNDIIKEVDVNGDGEVSFEEF